MEVKRCITSFRFESRTHWFEFTKPLMESYAASIGCDFFVPEKTYFDEWISNTPQFSWDAHHKICWLKIPLLSSLLDEYDEVVWIDSDVVIVGSDNIFNDITNAPISLATHNWESGNVPNSGVWAVRKPAKDILDTIEIDPHIADNAVWRRAIGYNGDQSMLLKRLGCDVQSRDLSMPPSNLWGELPYKYNTQLQDIAKETVFVHGCGPDPGFVFSMIVSSGIWDVSVCKELVELG